MTAPEVIEAREALAKIPAEWLNDRLVESVEMRAAVKAVDRELGQRAAMAQVSQDVAEAAILKVGAGDTSGLDDLIHAQHVKDTAAKLRNHLTMPAIDPAALQLAFTLADQSLNESDRAVSLPPLSFDAEMAAWRNHAAARLGAPANPPMATDLCRAASKRAAALQRDVDETLTWHQSWREWGNSTTADPLSLLAAAAGVLEQRKALAVKVQEAVALIGQANRQRRDAGLTWRPV